MWQTSIKYVKMDKKEIERICTKKADALLDKYFGNFVYEAAIARPETIGIYEKDLPLRIEAEYRTFLEKLWKEIAPDDKRTIKDILDKGYSNLMTEDDREGIVDAYRDARHRTIWERMTNNNHKDVTYYKGLLEVYARELLFWTKLDFLEEVIDYEKYLHES